MMTLARAMQVKNLLAGRLTEVNQKIQQSNSIRAGNEREVKVRELLELRGALVAKLLEIKVAISDANAPIRDQIYALAELKSSINFYRGIDTKHGKFAPEYRFSGSGTDEDWEAEIRAPEIEAMVKATRAEIDATQQKIDAHNASTSISVEVAPELLH